MASQWPRSADRHDMLVAAVYLLAINLLTYQQFASDKRRAVLGRRRIPEVALLRLAMLGGTVGAFAARHLLRHKTRKQPFTTWLQVIAMIHAGLGIGLGIAFLRS